MKIYSIILALILFHSIINGQDWVNQQNYRLNSIYFIDANYGWAVGINGIVLRTTDGGSNWIKENSGISSQLDDVFFVSQSTGWACGDDRSIRKTTDGGITWFEISRVSYIPHHTIHFVNTSTGWMGGYSRIYKTTDGGISWTEQYNGARCRSIYFIDENTGWAAFENGIIKRTTDGGTNWLDATTNPGGIYLAVDFVDNNNGWIAGGEDCVRKTTDGGDTWATVTTGFSGNSYWGLKFINSTTGWIVGTNGVILKTTDGGSNWSQQSTLTTDQLMAISIFGNNGWVCGFNGRILKNSATNPLPVELSSFNAQVDNNIVALNWRTETEVNNYGFEVERTQNGKKWIRLGFIHGAGNSNSPKLYTYQDDNPVGGNLFRYRLKQIDNDGKFEYSNVIEVKIIPDKFFLYQNYPNPFNPSTTIKWQLPSASNVTIKLFNSLGEEIATLLDEFQLAGIYSKSIILNSELPSGVYFYKLKAGGYVETNKMILIK